MNNIFKHEKPLVHIESFGLKNVYDSNYSKYYVTSLEFNNDSLFTKHTTTIYIPLLFTSEEDAKTFIRFYDNINFYFGGKYYATSMTRIYSKTYPLSTIDKIDKKLLKFADLYEGAIFYFCVNFTIKYSDYLIVISHGHDDVYLNKNFDDIISKDGESSWLEKIDNSQCDHYLFKKCYIKHVNNEDDEEYITTLKGLTFKEVLKYIDDLDAKKQQDKQKQNILYSKKTFKIVEDNATTITKY